MKKGISALLTALPMLAVLYFGEPLSASAGTYWEGVKGSVPLVRERDCPVEIESCKILFTIDEFPDPEAEEAEYDACMQARYTFRNPTNSEERVRVLFPAGGMCAYAPIAGGMECTVADGEGTPLNCRFRYTYLGNGMRAECVSEECRADEFFGEDTAVRHVSYSYSRPLNTERTYFRLELSYNPVKTRIAFDGSPKVTVEDGRVCAVWQTAEETGGFGYYAFGESAAEELSVSHDRARAIGGDAAEMRVNVTEETVPLGEFLEARRPAEIGASDWYNGFVDAMNLKQSLGFVFLSLDKFNASSFAKWCEYELSVPAEGRAENVVTMPLYPTVDDRDGGGDKTVYRYEYLLSPAQRWADLREIEIEIVTPYFLKESSLVFQKTEQGYAFRRDSLPLGELDFSLTEKETKQEIKPFRLNSTLTVLIVALCIFGGALIAGVTVCAVLLSKKKHRRAGTPNGTAEEGELPPEEKS